ncbi:hypothetical protein LSCM1_02578 [Leishmania martiniquensis]|uniref:J domain-containing protein n=1 Tax=Leishmania martiniquensis TaxID=1580590 RepID=A0A836FU49_9TRYP|nr:hypothetical protein LSCM1_02578 [Leishmania martiniquensis]
MADLYAVLELDRHATPEEIKRSYHRLALRYHPDKAGPEGTVRFKEVSTAYEVLSDPHKKDIYDRYGEAGLEALANPVAGVALATFGSTAPVLITIVTMFICAVMILLFLAFLVSFVDGRLRSWSYVKVFSPLFVLDICIGVPALILAVLLCSASPCSLHVHCILLALVCAIALTIVIPIAKDRNAAIASAGRTDFLQWRVLLIPGYLFSAFVTIAIVLTLFPTEGRLLRLKSMGLVRLANYIRIGFAIALLQGCCIVVFFALVACRADEVITINFFIVIGLPIFLLLTLLLVNRFALNLLSTHISDVPPEVAEAAAARELNANGGEAPAQHPFTEGAENRHSSPRGAPNPMRSGGAEERDSAHSQARTDAEGQSRPTLSDVHNHHGDHADVSEAQDQRGRASATNPYAGQHASICGVAANMLVSIIMVGLLMASTAMIAVRLNHYHHNGTYDGVLSLATACIPLFIISGAVVLVQLIACVTFGCCGVIMVAEVSATEQERGNRHEGKPENEDELQNDTRAGTTRPVEVTVPCVPHQEEATTGRPAVEGPATPPPVAPAPARRQNATPPEHQPDNMRLSDVD